MDLAEAMELARSGRSQAAAEAGEDVAFHFGTHLSPYEAERSVETFSGAFHEPTRMQRDAMVVLEDPAMWLTSAYSVALHLKWLLDRLGLWLTADEWSEQAADLLRLVSERHRGDDVMDRAERIVSEAREARDLAA